MPLFIGQNSILVTFRHRLTKALKPYLQLIRLKNIFPQNTIYNSFRLKKTFSKVKCIVTKKIIIIMMMMMMMIIVLYQTVIIST